MRVILLLLVVLVAGPGAAQTAANLLVAGFDQSLVLSPPFPHGPAPDWQEGNAEARIAEFVPGDETVTAWSQMITVTVLRNASGGDEAYQRGLAMLRGNYERGCVRPVEMRIEADLPLQGGLGARPVVLTCPQVAGATVGEAMAALVIRGAQDLYTLQWAERFPADGKATPIPPSVWDARLAHLGTARLCTGASGCP